MRKELELKKIAYQQAFIHNSMCTTTEAIERMWHNPIIYNEIYEVGIAPELRKFPDMKNDREHAMKVYKLRMDILQKAVKDIEWKLDFIKKNTYRSWWQRVMEYLFPNKHIISLKSLQQ